VEEMARRLSMATRRELKMAVGERYRAAARWERRQILDEFTRVTGYHRKHALRVLHRPFVARPAQPRRRIYDEAVRQALALLWEASDRICGKIPSDQSRIRHMCSLTESSHFSINAKDSYRRARSERICQELPRRTFRHIRATFPDKATWHS
jgi:hypothetical protein